MNNLMILSAHKLSELLMVLSRALTGSLVLLFALVFLTGVKADESSDNTWQWKLLKAELYDSEIAIVKKQVKIAHYQLDCDLSEYQNEDEFTPSINKIVNSKQPHGLLIVTCNVGAHAVRLNIFDPHKNTKEPIFSQTGSYLAYWEIESEQLWIIYDTPCTSSKAKQCEAPFEQVRIPWTQK